MKTHWKQLVNPDYIGAYSLPNGEDLIVKIISVARGMVTGVGGRTEECTIAQIENQKPFILNNTNCKTIAKLAGTPFIEEWSGKSIQLFASTTQLKGETVECLRIRDFKPQVKKPDLKKEDSKIWDAATNKISSVGFEKAIEAIEKHYTISDETKQLLKDETNQA